MKTLPFAALAALALLTASAEAQRLRIRFDDGWRFQKVDPPKPGDLDLFRWRWRLAPEANRDLRAVPADVEEGVWAGGVLGRDVFEGRSGHAWFQTDLGKGPSDARRTVTFEGVDDDATVFLNGTLLGHHEGYSTSFEFKAGSAWRPEGPNQLLVLVRNGDGPGGIMGAVTVRVADQPVVPSEALPTFKDAAWRKVQIPHDYVVEGKFEQMPDFSHGSLRRDPAWYRKAFAIPKAYRGKALWLQFDGIFRDAKVYFNGRQVAHQPSGYIGFSADLAPWARYGEANVLAVSVDPRQAEGWWYEGGGIYRHVWLNVADRLRIAPHGTFVSSRVASPLGSAPSAQLRLETALVNEGPARSFVLVSTVMDPNGRTVATVRSRHQLDTGKTSKVVQTATLAKARLWALGAPHLYRLTTTVEQGGRPIDRVETPFGIRTIRFDPNLGFFLNERPVKIQGACNHQDHAGLGVALPDGMQEWRIKRLLSLGSNAYRCAHNPPAPELLDACDRLGMLVMDETRHLGDTTMPKSAPGTPATELSELREMVLRDRNHPSVILWSMENEENIQATPDGARIFAAMKRLTLSLDPTRPVTAGMNFGWDSGIGPLCDAIGFNYNIGTYDRIHAQFPSKPLYGSETASAVATRGIYANDAERGYVSAYDAVAVPWGATAENAWKPIAERPWMAGGFVWTGFDYKGEPTPYGWPCINSHFGVLDICGFPKDSAWYYRAWWGSKPVTHITPHWNWKEPGKVVDVWVHSNAERVELFLNGKSLGAQAMPRFGHLEWKVPYAPGTLYAIGTQGGRLVSQHRVETTGAPAGIRLRTDRPFLIADGQDVSPIEVEVVDAAGRTVPTASNPLTFAVSGPGEVAGVGNGDPSSHEPDKASSRKAFNGLAMVLVRAGRKAETVVVTAQSPGLKSATIRLPAKP